MPSLREIAKVHSAAIIGDAGGFGVPVTVRNPAGDEAELQGLDNDIGSVIDPQTGMIASGRVATVTLSISALSAAGFELPEGVANEAVKPWVVAIEGDTFKVIETRPDRTLDCVVCFLGAYEDAA